METANVILGVSLFSSPIEKTTTVTQLCWQSSRKQKKVKPPCWLLLRWSRKRMFIITTVINVYHAGTTRFAVGDLEIHITP